MVRNHKKTRAKLLGLKTAVALICAFSSLSVEVLSKGTHTGHCPRPSLHIPPRRSFSSASVRSFFARDCVPTVSAHAFRPRPLLSSDWRWAASDSPVKK